MCMSIPPCMNTLPFDGSQLEQYMRRCMELAIKANAERIRRPYVGAIVVVPDGRIVGEGHRTVISGTNLLVHAERDALDKADSQARGSYLFTTLEPCAISFGNRIFAPCAELIVERGIHTVVYGLLDNSPTMQSGRGVDYLTRHRVSAIRYDGPHADAIRHDIRRELMPWQAGKR